MEIKFKYISKEKAEEIVAQTPHEPTDTEKVKFYTELMNNGEWVNVNEYHLFNKKHYATPLIFTDEGFLWEGKHRIYALANSESAGYKFVCIYGWDRNKATEEYQTGKMRYFRWGYLVNALYKFSGHGYEPTEVEDIYEI